MKKNSTKRNDRRQFLKQAALGSSALMSAPFLMSNRDMEERKDRAELPEGTTLLFQGDSITDAGRLGQRLRLSNFIAFTRRTP